MLRILSIGNSFSQDAHAMLHDQASSVGIAVETANLYIANCSLQRHWCGIAQDNRDALYERNGADTGRHLTIAEALAIQPWDIVTLQQSSPHSGQYETYFPYLSNFVGWIHNLLPSCRLWLHETWAYDQDSDRPAFAIYEHSQRRMFEAIREANHRAAAKLGLSLIPSGELIQALRALPAFDPARGGRSLTRDGFHLDLLYGRWAVAALWLECLCGADAREIRFLPEGGDPVLLHAISEVVHRTAQLTRE